MSEERPIIELTDVVTPGNPDSEPVIELTDVVNTAPADSRIIELTDVVDAPDYDAVIELTDMVNATPADDAVIELSEAVDEPAEAGIAIEMPDDLELPPDIQSSGGLSEPVPETPDVLVETALHSTRADTSLPEPEAPASTLDRTDDPAADASGLDPADMSAAGTMDNGEDIDELLSLPDDVQEALGGMMDEETQIGMDTDPNLSLDDVQDDLVASMGITIDGDDDETESDAIGSDGPPSTNPPMEALAGIPAGDLDASIERVVRRLFEPRIEGIIVEIVENAINKEMARLNTLLLGKGTGESADQ